MLADASTDSEKESQTYRISGAGTDGVAFDLGDFAIILHFEYGHIETTRH